MKVLFITWDGAHQNYLESLYFPLFRELRKDSIEVHVLQLSWGSAQFRKQRSAVALDSGVRYRCISVGKRATALNVAMALMRAQRIVKKYIEKEGIEAVMPRSVIPCAIALSAIKRLKTPPRLIYDADGFSQDERVDFGRWDGGGLRYRLYRDVETQGARRAQRVITRTQAARDILMARAGAGVDESKYSVIPNGSDETRFRPLSTERRERVRSTIGAEPFAPVIVYAGSLGPQYYPLAMFEFFQDVRSLAPNAFLVILTGQESVAKEAMVASGSNGEGVMIARVNADEVSEYLGAADLGLSFRSPSFSQKGVSPIKVGEYLLCGLPVVATAGVGDLDLQMDATVGLAIQDVNRTSLLSAANWFVETVVRDRDAFRRRCRARGVGAFGLTAFSKRFAAVLRDVEE